MSAEAVRAASDLEKGDEGTLFADDQRAICTAVLDARQPVSSGTPLDLAVDHARLHFFDLATGEALGAGARAVALA